MPQVDPSVLEATSAQSVAENMTRETVMESMGDNLRRMEEILSRVSSYRASIMEYRGALREVETRLKVIDDEFGLGDDNPIETIETRIKTTKSIVRKMVRRDIPVSVKNMEDEIFDIAGIRVICSFVEDVYRLAESLSKQEDLRIIQIKDYIRSPKPNGYRSYHMIVEVPFYLSDRRVTKRVELQFRTIAMDFWASLEHKMRYKKEYPSSDEVHQRLAACAQISAALDYEMQELRRLIRSLS